MKNTKINFEEITLRSKISHRGGGIEISLDTLGFLGECMTAYQNYLGGGILGRVCSDCTITDWESNDKLEAIAEQLRRYFHSLTNPDTDWESGRKTKFGYKYDVDGRKGNARNLSRSYDQNQKMPESVY